MNRPYNIFFAAGNHTCSIADLTGTRKGPMKVVGGKSIPPTGKRFHVEFCTGATGNEDGEITEERLFYDLVSFMKQIGLIYSDHPRRVPSLPSVHVLGGDLK